MYLCYCIYHRRSEYRTLLARAIYHRVKITDDGELVWKWYSITPWYSETYINRQMLTAVQAVKKFAVLKGVPRMDRPSTGKKVTEREAGILTGMAGYAGLDWLRENVEYINSPELKNYQKPRKKRSSKS